MSFRLSTYGSEGICGSIGGWELECSTSLASYFCLYLVLLLPGILNTCFNGVADESITQNELNEVGSRVSRVGSSGPVGTRNAGASRHVLVSAGVVGNPSLTDPFLLMVGIETYSRISRFSTILQGKNDCAQQRSCISCSDYQLRSHNHLLNPHRQRSKRSISLRGYYDSYYKTLSTTSYCSSVFARPELFSFLNTPLKVSLQSYCVQVQLEKFVIGQHKVHRQPQKACLHTLSCFPNSSCPYKAVNC